MKKIRFILIGIVSIVVFSGCVHSGKYQLVPAQNKDSYVLFKLDKTTGETWALDKEGWLKLEDKK